MENATRGKQNQKYTHGFFKFSLPIFPPSVHSATVGQIVHKTASKFGQKGFCSPRAHLFLGFLGGGGWWTRRRVLVSTAFSLQEKRNIERDEICVLKFPKYFFQIKISPSMGRPESKL